MCAENQWGNFNPALTVPLTLTQAGKSAWCKTHEACTRATPPDAPGAATAAAATVDSVSVTWAPPASDGGSPVQGYEVEVQTPWLPQEAGVWRKVSV
jgi:hypothetical protein